MMYELVKMAIKIKKFRIDFSKVSGYVEREEDEIIRKALQREKLYSQDFLYSVCNGERASQIEKKGQYRNPAAEGSDSIFAFTLDELVWDVYPRGPNDIKTHAKQYLNPAIAIYHRSHFAQETDGSYEYIFNNPKRKKEALAGIALFVF